MNKMENEKAIANEMTIEMDCLSKNESFARMVVAAFATQLNPTLSEVADLKTAVSEAVTNAIIHAFPEEKGTVKIHAWLAGRTIYLEVIDEGIGIRDVKKAMEPMYTSKSYEERSGMGFVFMEAFMDELLVTSEPMKGTCVYMSKEIGKESEYLE